MIKQKEMIAEQKKGGKSLSGFQPGNQHFVQRQSNKAQELRNICMDVMTRKTAGGRTLIEDCLLAVARESPNDFLRFAQKLLPKEVEHQVRKASPIVIVNNNVSQSLQDSENIIAARTP